MKYTGIVRRLDSLGRIVIPREYRKMLKIRESDPLEIIALENGEIIVRKIDLSAELISHGEPVLKCLFEALDKSVVLADKERFLATKGSGLSEFIDKKIGARALNLIEQRKSYIGKAQDFNLEGGNVLFCPIASEDVFGAFLVISDKEITNDDERLVSTVAKILGGEMQKY